MHHARQLLILSAVAFAGAGCAIWLNLPVPLLTGPAILATVLSLLGWSLVFPTRVRDIVFLLTGITIGAGVSRESISALATWPMAFAAMSLGVVLMMLANRALLTQVFRADRTTALLAATPGHLSFVIASGEEAGADTRKIVVVQSIRLLMLTLLVPVLASSFGIDTSLGAAFGSAFHEMSLFQTAGAIVLAAFFIPFFKRTRVPAPVLLSGMFIGASARLTEIADGGLSHWISWPALAMIGVLIGTRFVGITGRELRQYGLAGLLTTTTGALITLGAAWVAMWIVDMPLVHVLVAFAPGGLETMAAIGVAIGANPGFVAAAHVLRLLVISAILPFLLARN